MNRTLASFAALVLAVLVSACSNPASPTPTTPPNTSLGTIRAILRAPEGVSPQGVVVDVNGTRVVSDAQGIVPFSGLPVGASYSVAASGEGFVPTSVSVTLSQPVQEVSIALTPVLVVVPTNMNFESVTPQSGSTLKYVALGAEPLVEASVAFWSFPKGTTISACFKGVDKSCNSFTLPDDGMVGRLILKPTLLATWGVTTTTSVVILVNGAQVLEKAHVFNWEQ